MSHTTSNTNNSLTIALTHAISFLTRPLVPLHTPHTIDTLHTSLELLLTALVQPTWPAPYVLSCSPNRLPHPAIWKASNAARVRWSEWIAALGGFEFDLVIRPGKVHVTIGAWGGAAGESVIWEERPCKQQLSSSALFELHPEDEDEIFDMIDQERAAGPGGMQWRTPVVDRFPVHVPHFSMMPTTTSMMMTNIRPFPSTTTISSSFSAPIISRPSSRSSSTTTSSSGSTSLFSDIESLSSASSSVDLMPTQHTYHQQQPEKRHRSRRSRPKVTPEVFIDATKKEVTNYDGGKTTVLTGGVMLGSRAAPPKAQRW